MPKVAEAGCRCVLVCPNSTHFAVAAAAYGPLPRRAPPIRSKWIHITRSSSPEATESPSSHCNHAYRDSGDCNQEPACSGHYEFDRVAQGCRRPARGRLFAYDGSTLVSNCWDNNCSNSGASGAYAAPAGDRPTVTASVERSAPASSAPAACIYSNNNAELPFRATRDCSDAGDTGGSSTAGATHSGTANSVSPSASASTAAAASTTASSPAPAAIAAATTSAGRICAAASITPEEAVVYDRQIRLWGVRTQSLLARSRILFVGVTWTTVEAMKSLVLAGIPVTVCASGPSLHHWPPSRSPEESLPETVMGGIFSEDLLEDRGCCSPSITDHSGLIQLLDQKAATVAKRLLEMNPLCESSYLPRGRLVEALTNAAAAGGSTCTSHVAEDKGGNSASDDLEPCVDSGSVLDFHAVAVDAQWVLEDCVELNVLCRHTGKAFFMVRHLPSATGLLFQDWQPSLRIRGPPEEVPPPPRQSIGEGVLMRTKTDSTHFPSLSELLETCPNTLPSGYPKRPQPHPLLAACHRLLRLERNGGATSAELPGENGLICRTPTHHQLTPQAAPPPAKRQRAADSTNPRHEQQVPLPQASSFLSCSILGGLLAQEVVKFQCGDQLHHQRHNVILVDHATGAGLCFAVGMGIKPAEPRRPSLIEQCHPVDYVAVPTAESIVDVDDLDDSAAPAAASDYSPCSSKTNGSSGSNASHPSRNSGPDTIAS